MNAWRAAAIAGTIVCLGLVLVTYRVEAEPPIIIQYIEPIELWYDESYSVDLMDYKGGPVFEGPDGDDLTYGFDTDGDILVSINGSVVTFQPRPDFCGSSIGVSIWAEDVDGNISERMHLFFMIHDRGPPIPAITTFEPNTTRVSTLEDEAITFRILEVEDLAPEQWSVSWVAAGLQVSTTDSREFTFPDQTDPDKVYNGSGTYTVWAHVVYDDGEWASTISFSWTVIVLDANRLPYIDYITGDQSLSPGDDVQLQVVARDPDWDNLSYRWFNSQDQMTMEYIGSGSSISYETDLPSGTYYFTCELNDSRDTMFTDWVVIVVEDKEDGSPTPPWAATAVIIAAIAVLAIVIRIRTGHRKAY